MRLHVADRFSRGREVPKGGMTICGTFVPAGVTVGVWADVVQHWKEVFGEDMNIFRPERWLESEEKATRMTNAMLSFGNGKYACLGKYLARLESQAPSTFPRGV
jgi:cytochrome P450